MRIFQKALTLDVIHAITHGELLRKTDILIDNLADPYDSNETSVIFFENEKYLAQVLTAPAGLIITKPTFKDALSGVQTNLIIVENPYQAILMLLHYWLELEKAAFEPLVHPLAVIGKNVILAENVHIEALAVIEDGAVIGNYTTIKSLSHVGKNVRIGEHCLVYPNVTIYEDCMLGNNVCIHSGTVIGADGFGYLLMQGIQQKIPQVGNVIIHDNVEIGANTGIDRGTIGSTIIGEGTKIDNLVQIGHNCIIGKHSIVCAQVGLAGSTHIGDYVYLAGQVGAAGHLKVGDRTMVGAQAGISSDLPPDGKFFGTPARESQKMKRIMAVENNLPEMYKFFNQLKRDKERE